MSLLDDLVAALPAGWLPVRSASGAYINNDHTIWVTCPAKHHVRAYLSDIQKASCLSCAEKRDRAFLAAAESLFGVPFSKRTPQEGFLAVSLAFGLEPVSSRGRPPPARQDPGVLWVSAVRRKTIRSSKASILQAIREAELGADGGDGTGARVSLPKKLVAILAERRESRKKKAISLAASENPLAFAAGRFTGGLTSFSGLSFEQLATPH